MSNPKVRISVLDYPNISNLSIFAISGGQVIHSQQFQGYNPYEQRSRPFAQQSLPTMYTHNIVYVPVPEAASATIVPDQQHQQVTDQVSDKNTGKGK